MQKTLGGDRLGSGKKMKVELHGYERSTHDLGYLWRSTMSAGTLVPFLCEVALPGDTFDIDLNAIIKTHPTIGPLFGSYKVQLDLFQCPVRLYQGQLHNNKIGIGMNMSSIKLPQMGIVAIGVDPLLLPDDIDNMAINPSMILSYLGYRGPGMLDVAIEAEENRDFNALPLLMYWDIYKNYYANKQEEIGAVIHSEHIDTIQTVDSIAIDGVSLPTPPAVPTSTPVSIGMEIAIFFTGATPDINQLILNTTNGPRPINSMGMPTLTSPGVISIIYNGYFGVMTVNSWQYANQSTQILPPKVATFPLSNIDDMREYLLNNITVSPIYINNFGQPPYSWALDHDATSPVSWTAYTQTQEGLAIKTYQSDLFNNWLSTEWIDGPGGINDITAIDTSGGSFNLDTLNLSKKVYDMLNRIAVSGGTYDDWMDAVWAHDRYTRSETPTYHGGLSKELVFQEVISNAQSDGEQTQPLGTLGGRGVMSDKHKGGHAIIKVDEPSYIIGLISLTPRLDYSQGNKWDVNLKTMDDFHKPALDEIGFQELITEQMHWASTEYVAVDGWTTKSAGKQPAWINYMTNVNQVRGNFAIANNEMFMTLNRRYEYDKTTMGIKDLTTYIDPVKFNHIFAQTAIDAQNFWAQISVNITARRKMSAKIMPNL